MISEEDEGIMSTGGALDEDGINQSVIYTSSIRSVKRNLEDASGDVAAIQILNSYPPSSETMGVQEESKLDALSPQTNKIMDYIYVQHEDVDGTPITANFETYANHQEPLIKEQFVTNGGNTTESEEE